MDKLNQRRRFTALGVSLVLVAATATAVSATAAAAPVKVVGGSGLAGAQARAGGHRVEVMAARTETSQLFANPDGSHTVTEYARPVRVRSSDGGWQPVDTTVVHRADGTVGPRAVAVELSFGGGGGTDLVRLGSGGHRVTLAWPLVLPKPTLSADTATYANVLPGVDLKVSADVDGFTEVLVVHDRAAAGNPALAAVSFDVRGDGLTTRTDAAGDIDLVDDTGTAVFHGGAPTMWDSTSPTAPHSAAMRTAVAGNRLTVVPNAAMLTAADTKFPLYIDPSFTATRSAWTAVWKEHPDTNYLNAADVARVGYEDEDGMTNRSLFQMGTAAVNGKHILSATFRIWENWAYSCNPRTVELWETDGISNATTWNQQPAWRKRIATANTAKGYNASCAAGNVEFNALAAVNDAAANGWPNLTLGLRADESDTWAWKKFNNNPQLTIVYNTPPSTPTNLSISDCYEQCSSPAVVSKTNATLRATVNDADAGDLLTVAFEVWNADYSTRVAFENLSVTGVPRGATASWQQNTSRADAATYHFRARSYDDTDYSPWSAWFTFSTDATRPDQSPAVASTDYPTGGFAGGIGVAGQFHLDPQGVADVAEYYWGVGQDEPTTRAAADFLGGPATITVTPTSDGPQTLFVRSVDRAGNLSDITKYRFYVGLATGPEAVWQLDETTGDTAADATGHGHSATASKSGAVTWTAGHEGNAAHFAGSGGLETTKPVLYTDQSFTVSAWVLIDDKGDFRTAVSQDGKTDSAFFLQYAKDADRWVFAMPESDTVNPTQDRVLSADAPQVNVWTHLVGVHDAQSGQLRLYVDGVLQGAATHRTPWMADGPLVIGAARWNNSTLINPWSGDIDDVQVFFWAMSDNEVGQLD